MQLDDSGDDYGEDGESQLMKIIMLVKAMMIGVMMGMMMGMFPDGENISLALVVLTSSFDFLTSRAINSLSIAREVKRSKWN